MGRHAGLLEGKQHDISERNFPLTAWWPEYTQEAATNNLSVSAVNDNQDKKVVSMR